MASTYTTNYHFEKPDPNADININPINSDLELIDTTIHSLQTDTDTKTNRKTLQEYVYCQLTSSGSGSTSTISAYPTKPGVYRVGSPAGIAGLPSGIIGYGCLVIFNGGTYCGHIYIDNNRRLYWGIITTTGTTTVTPPSKWRWVQGTEVDAAT